MELLLLFFVLAVVFIAAVYENIRLILRDRREKEQWRRDFYRLFNSVHKRRIYGREDE